MTAESQFCLHILGTAISSRAVKQIAELVPLNPGN